MRITESQLKQIVREELMGVIGQEIVGNAEGEGSMARTQLARISEISAMLSDMIEESTNLEEWVESKITKAQDYLSSVLNYMRGEEAKLKEKLDPAKDDAGDYVEDFYDSDAPKFKGKSKKKRREMAVAAYLQAKGKKK